MRADSTDTRNTFIVFATVFLLLFLFFDFRWAVYVALGSLGLIIIPNPLAAPAAGLWLLVGRWIGIVNTRIILTAVFYLVLFPTALIRRLIVRRTVSGDSAFEQVEKTWGKDTFRRPY